LGSPGIVANFVLDAESKASAVRSNCSASFAQFFGDILVGASRGSFSAVGAFVQQKLSRSHGVF
jgi:hypothetical protein